MRDVFISHVEEDSTDALEIAASLEAAGYSTWCYERDSIPGPSYLVQTGDAVEGSRAIVVLISRHSLGSRQVTVEIVRGHETAKPFIPVLVGLSHVDFTNRQPEWREAMGAATSIMVPREGAAAIVPRIVQGLRALGVEPSGETTSQPQQVATGPRKESRRPRLPTLIGVGVAGLVVVALAIVLSVKALSGGGTETDGSTSQESTARGQLTTNVGEARVTDVSLASEFCPPANFPGDCVQSTDGHFLIVTLAGAGDAPLTIAVTQQSYASYVAHGEDRYRPATSADEYQGVVRLVYTGAPASLAGEDVTLVWSDGQKVKLRVSR